MPRFRNPSYIGGGGSVASSGFSVAPPPGGDNGMGGVAQAIAGLVGSAMYDPENDPKAQQAGYYKSETALNTAKLGSQNSVADILANLTPENAADIVRQVQSAAARGGGDAKNVAAAVLSTLSMGGNEDMVRRAHAGAGGAPLGPDASFTEPSQAAIRDGNFAQQTSVNDATIAGSERNNAATNATSRANNTETVAGAMERERLQESGRMGRRYDQPHNTPQGTTTSYAPGDPRATGPTVTVAPRKDSLDQVIAGMVEGGNWEDAQKASDLKNRTQPKPAVDFKTTDEVDGEINAQIGVLSDGKGGLASGSNPRMDPALQARVRARAIELFRVNQNPTQAVKEAIDELTSPEEKTRWFRPNETLRVPKAGGAPSTGANVDDLLKKYAP